MSVRLGTTVIAGSLDINAIKQAIYDGMFPVGYEHIGIACIGVPEGVTATWTEQTELNNRYPVVLSTSAVKTLLNEELPNIYGTIGCLRNTSVKTGCFSGSYGSTDWQTCADGGYPAGQLGYNVGVFNARAFNPVYTEGGAVRPLSYTVKHWKRTA